MELIRIRRKHAAHSNAPNPYTAHANAPGRSRRERGVTLLELLIAMLVLAFGLLTVAAAQMHAMSGSRTGRHTTQAAIVAENQMEQLQRRNWTDIPATNWTAPVAVDNTVEGPTTSVEQSYAVQWRIGDIVANQRRSIDVRVTWSEPNRPNRSYSISSVRYNFEGL